MKSARTARTAPFHLTGTEAVTAVLGLVLAAESDDAKLGAAAMSAVGNIVAASPAGLQDELRGIVADMIAPEKGDDPEEFLATVEGAIRDERKLRISYVDQTGERSNRTIKPLALAESRAGESIAAWCELRRGFRHFRLDRIDGVAALNSYFKGERDELLDRYLEEN